MSKLYQRRRRRDIKDLENFLRDQAGDGNGQIGYEENLSADTYYEPCTESSPISVIEEENLSTEVASEEILINADTSTLNFSDEGDDFDAIVSEVESDTNDEDFGAIENHIVFQESLKNWAARSNCSREKLNELLSILRANGHENLPKDIRTLLQQSSKLCVSRKCGGSFIYLGIKGQLEKISSFLPYEMDTFHIKVNVDGVPIFKSSGFQLWPILGAIEDFQPFVIAIYSGTKKPDNVASFLEDFLLEHDVLKHSGITIDSRKYNVVFKCFICDAPARQFMKGIKGHNGYYGCERCTIKGVYNEGVMTFSDLDCEKRTHKNFSNMVYVGNHQIIKSPLVDSGINCVQHFVLDYMHVVCLGVVKRFLTYLKEGPRLCRLSATQVTQISDRLIEIQGKMPTEFARQPRGLDELKRWKATELRQFLLFTGPVVLKSVLSKSYYQHFLVLSVAMNILLDRSKVENQEMLQYAHQLFKYYVTEAVHLFGEKYVSYNVHSLIHLCEDVSEFDVTLDQISSFEFENFLQAIKRCIKNANNPIVQVVHHIDNITSVLKKKHFTKVSTIYKDSYFVLKDNRFIKIKKILRNGFYCNIYQPRAYESFFTTPLPSRDLGITLVRDKLLFIADQFLTKASIKRKVCGVPYQNGYVFLPLLHDAIFP